MSMMIPVAAIAAIFYLFILLLPVALLIALQVWLCKKGRWLGLILPALSLTLSLLLTIGLVSYGTTTRVVGGATHGGSMTVDEHGNVTASSSWSEEHPDTRRYVMERGLGVATVSVFLVSSVPTLVFGGIWLHFKNRRDLQEDMRRMRLEDLE